MKKLFLTSGIIACMACPAFADPTQPGFTISQSSPSAESTATGECVQPSIGTYSGSTTLVAQWTNDFALMKLNDNNGSTTATGGDTSHTANGSVWTTSDLYITALTSATEGSEAGKVVYKKDANDNFNLQTPSDAAVVSIPQGAQLTYAVTTTVPGTGEVDEAITPIPDRRVFRGYFASDATNSTPDSAAYIDNAGKVTSDAPVNYDNANPWKALYTTASPDLSGTPSAYGYTFLGWAIDGDTTTLKTTADVNASNRYESGTAVAQWQAKVWDVTFSCGTGTITNAPAATTWTFDSIFTVPANADTTGCGKAGSHFTGWQCKQGDNVVYEPSQTISNGSATSMMSASLTADVYASLADDTPNANSGTTTNDIVCTAQYVANNISITWDGAGEDGAWTAPTPGTGAGVCTYGSDVTIPANPTRTGYTFNGWAVGTGDDAPIPDSNLANQ